MGYKEIQNYFIFLSGNSFNEYLNYSFNLSGVTNNDIFVEGLKKHIENNYLEKKSNAFSITFTEVFEWKNVISDCLSEFDLDDAVLSEISSLFEDFIGTNSIDMWKITSDLFWGVFQRELLLKVNNMYYYLLLYVND